MSGYGSGSGMQCGEPDDRVSRAFDCPGRSLDAGDQARSLPEMVALHSKRSKEAIKIKFVEEKYLRVVKKKLNNLKELNSC